MVTTWQTLQKAFGTRQGITCCLQQSLRTLDEMQLPSPTKRLEAWEMQCGRPQQSNIDSIQ